MKLIMFINEVLSSAVDALSDCSDDNVAAARAKLFAISRKIQSELPAIKVEPAPTPEHGKF